MTRRTRNINFCQNNPDKYKLCSSYICVPVGLSCPCVAKEHFQCSDGKCLPPGFLCDGYRDCADGHDEDICHRVSGQRSLPLAVGVGVGSVVIISVIITIIIVFMRRRKRQCIANEPAKEPLQNGNSTSDPSSSDSPPSSSPNAQFKYDNDTDFYDVLCTSTPRPDTRRLVNPGNLRMGDNQKEKRIQTKTV